MKLMRFPVDRPVTTLMIFFAFSLFGAISWTRLPQQLFPSLEYPQISIVTKYEGAGPEESEKLISKLIEEALGTVKNVTKVRSVSKEGVSIVTCDFKWGTDMNFAAMDVREKIDLIKESLPKDAWEPIVLKFNPFQMEAMLLSVSFKNEEKDPWKLAELRATCKKNLKDELERLDGVAKVDLRGGEKKEVLVEVDKGRLLANQISITEVISSIRDSNITYPAGMIKEDQYEYLVKTIGEFQNLNDISSLSFSKEDRSNQERRSYRRVRGEVLDARKTVFIRDIADVRESLKDQTGYSRYNLKDTISLAIFPQSGSNLVSISKVVNKKLNEIRPTLPENIEVQVIYDQSQFIKSSLSSIYTNAFFGGVLSFIVLYIFLLSLTASSIICTAIPLSILITAILMYFGKISINTMSLSGLAMGVGMVVDNANIVVDNIFTYYQKNPTLDKKTIISNATQEVASPILGETLTTVAVFLPLVFIAGVAGQLFKELALTITFSMLSSIIVAIILVPRLSMGLDFSKYSGKSHETIRRYFVPILSRIMKWSAKKVSFLIFIFFAVGMVIFMIIPKEFMPKIDERRFVLDLKLHPETPLAMTNVTSRRIEEFLGQMPEVKDIAATIGSTEEEEGGAGAISALGAYQARILVNLKPKGRSTKKIVEALSDEVQTWGIKGLETDFITQQGLFGSQIGATSGLTIEVRGKDLYELSERAKDIQAKISTIPEIFGIKMEPSDFVPELKLIIDRERASLFGFSTQDISAMSLAAIKGYVATKLKQKEDEFDIRIRLRPQDRDTLEKVGELTLYSPWGMTLQLKQMSDMKFVESLPEIQRINGQRTYFITAQIRDHFAKTVRQIGSIFDELPKKEDVTQVITGELLELQDSTRSSLFAIILGVIIIYMILAAEFESVTHPIIVMTTVPVGITGAFYLLFVSFQSLNSISMLGLIMLAGNAVNGAILIIDRYNLSLSQGCKNFEEMIINSTSDCVRPIIMTHLTTIVGLVPLALGIGEGASATSAMSIAMIGGVVSSGVFTIFLVPLIYYLTYPKSKLRTLGLLPAKDGK
jgi:hydrophobic/amphiphilic exporter-1 (mainly G- bacteria), HAE1 family